MRWCGYALRLFSPAASLVYRLPASWVGPKLPWKVLHATLHLLAFTLTVVGLVAVFQFHNYSKISHLYSLHSWLGITTVVFFACQVGALCPPSKSLWASWALGVASLTSAPNSLSAVCLERASYPVDSAIQVALRVGVPTLILFLIPVTLPVCPPHFVVPLVILTPVHPFLLSPPFPLNQSNSKNDFSIPMPVLHLNYL